MEQRGRGGGQFFQFGLGAVAQDGAAQHRDTVTGEQIGGKMRRCSVDDDVAERKFACDTARGHDIVKTMRVEVDGKFAAHNGEKRFAFGVEFRFVFVFVSYRFFELFVIFLCGAQLFANDRGGRHTGDGRLAFTVVGVFRVFAECHFHRDRCFDEHLVGAYAERFDRTQLTADRVGAAGACHHGGDAGFARFRKATVERVNGVDRA